MALAGDRSAASARAWAWNRVLAPAAAAMLLASCAAPLSTPAAKPMATVQRIDGQILRLTLEATAVQRIGIETVPVRGVPGSVVIPLSALIYDTEGVAHTYTNPRPLVFERELVQVKAIRGNDVVLADDLPPGVMVVSVGASQLLGIELGIGA